VLLGDGSAMYSIQALWTAAHQKLPITFVVFNNGGYRIIKRRLKLFHGTDRFIGMDFVNRRAGSSCRHFSCIQGCVCRSACCA
jgi:thiamine pyrophosphate-dependent acetolactate synthase large subunit-like protein